MRCRFLAEEFGGGREFVSGWGERALIPGTKKIADRAALWIIEFFVDVEFESR